MSAGPIKAARDAWKPPVVSTSNVDRVCKAVLGGAYCGRTPRASALTTEWDETTCADCRAGARADGLDVPR